MKQVTIIKIGGNIIDDEKALVNFLDAFSEVEGPKILVHGGGKLATELATKLGIETQMNNGRRITDAETLKITCMVYTGWINKMISAQLNAKGVKALGLSGADLFIILSEKRKSTPIDFGFVGDVKEKGIDVSQLASFLESGITPVVAPITSDSEGQLLNTNADTIAFSLARSLSSIYKVQLIYCFEKNGVLHNSEVIPVLRPQEFAMLKENNSISGGMIPKLENAFAAVEKGVNKVIIGHASDLHLLIKNHGGTHITIH